MTLTDFWFVLFFAAVYAVLWLIRLLPQNKELPVRTAVLLAASWLFTAAADWRFCICILLLTVWTWAMALAVQREKERGGSGKGLIGAAAAVILVQLGVFKYLGFFASSIGRLIGNDSVTVQLLIPIGVSFYSFSAIGYLIDVYRGKYAAYRSFASVALYIAFFPKLTSGPIVRADRFIGQLDGEHHVSLRNLETGIQIVLCGVFRKMVVADHLAVFVDQVFGAPKLFSGGTVLLAVLSYALQIYFDFAGYSDIAIGLSKMLGFEFDRNFDLPYLSQNPTEFWKRWHISLSSWLQEYLYYPLGGNRKGTVRTYLNLFLTMLLGGFWHGADWTFLIWGGAHGLALVVHKLFMKWKTARFGSRTAGNGVWKAVSTILTFAFASFCWIFFRADSIAGAGTVLASVFSGADGIVQIYTWTFFALAVLVTEEAAALLRNRKEAEGVHMKYLLLDLTKLPSLALFFILVGITVILAFVGDTVFIYGKF